MIKSVWINLPVKDVNKSKDFFVKIGFKLNLQYGSRDDSACLIASERNFIIMLFEEAIFEGFVSTNVSDVKTGAEYLLSFDVESVAEVDEIAKKVVEAGGKLYAEPGFKDGWMYGCGFTDLDGHRWNILYMDMSKMPLG